MRPCSLRIVGPLLLGVLGLIALTAVTAQAENLTDGGKPAEFLVNRETTLAKAGVHFHLFQKGVSALSVKERNLGILCSAGVIVGEFKSAKEALGSASFSNCKAFEWVDLENKKEVKIHTKELPCAVTEPISVKNAIALPRKHEGEAFVLLEEDPTTKEKEEKKSPGFTSVTLTGEECALPKTTEIRGSLSVAIDGNNRIEPSVLASQESQELGGSKLTFGGFPAQIKSEAKTELTGGHIGLTVGVLATEFLVSKEGALAVAGVTFAAEQIGRGALWVQNKFALLCETGAITGEFVSRWEVKGEGSFSKCSVWAFAQVEAGKEHITKLPCTVAEPIVVASTRAIPEKHGGEPYVLLSPIGKLFTVLTFSGPECALFKTNELQGTLGAKIDSNLTINPSLLFGELVQKLLEGKIPYGTFEVFTKSELKIKLSDKAHAGLTFGVL